MISISRVCPHWSAGSVRVEWEGALPKGNVDLILLIDDEGAFVDASSAVTEKSLDSGYLIFNESHLSTERSFSPILKLAVSLNHTIKYETPSVTLWPGLRPHQKNALKAMWSQIVTSSLAGNGYWCWCFGAMKTPPPQSGFLEESGQILGAHKTGVSSRTGIYSPPQKLLVVQRTGGATKTKNEEGKEISDIVAIKCLANPMIDLDWCVVMPDGIRYIVAKREPLKLFCGYPVIISATLFHPGKTDPIYNVNIPAI